MKVGTRSILFGVHQFIVHPLLVWVSWILIYGARPDWRTAASIFLHDIGYFGCADMDGEEGSRHPEFGAKLAGWWLGESQRTMVLFHSRYTATAYQQPVSAICLPDKLSLFLYPGWLYTLLSILSGEYREYQVRMGLTDVPRSQLIHHFRVRAFQWATQSDTAPDVKARVNSAFLASYRRSCKRTMNTPCGTEFSHRLRTRADPTCHTPVMYVLVNLIAGSKKN